MGGARLTLQQQILRAIKESEWQKTVIAILQSNGYLIYHDTALMAKQYRAGFPDLVCVRADPRDFFMAELKRETGKLRPDQEVWIEYLTAAKIPVYVWRPSDIDEVIERAKR